MRSRSVTKSIFSIKKRRSGDPRVRGDISAERIFAKYCCATWRLAGLLLRLR